MVLQKREYTAHPSRILFISWQKVYSTGLSLSLSLSLSLFVVHARLRIHKFISTHMLIYSHAHTPACSQKHIHMHDVYADTSIQAQVHACTDILALIHILVFLWCNVFRLILDFFFFMLSGFLTYHRSN